MHLICPPNKHCFEYLLGRLQYPEEMKNKGSAKFGVANKVWRIPGSERTQNLSNRLNQVQHKNWTWHYPFWMALMHDYVRPSLVCKQNSSHFYSWAWIFFSTVLLWEFIYSTLANFSTSKRGLVMKFARLTKTCVRVIKCLFMTPSVLIYSLPNFCDFCLKAARNIPYYTTIECAYWVIFSTISLLFEKEYIKFNE